jgi:hypothetical protein
MSQKRVRGSTSHMVSSQNFLLNGTTNPSVKFVPRLGPFRISRVSKKVIESLVEWNVTENKPPYPPLGYRQASYKCFVGLFFG